MPSVVIPVVVVHVAAPVLTTSGEVPARGSGLPTLPRVNESW